MDYSYTYKNRNSSTRNLRPQPSESVDTPKAQKKVVQFHTDTVYLEQRLFDPIRPKLGPKTILNMTVLPDYLAYIKQQLSAAQKTGLSEYHLQNLLMEYAIGSQNINLYQIQQPDNNAKPSQCKRNSNVQNKEQLQNQDENDLKNNKADNRSNAKGNREPLDTLQKLTNAILKYVRNRDQYWFKKSKQVQADQKQKQHHAIQTYQTHMKEISCIESRYCDIKAAQLKDYQVFIPEIELYAKQSFRLRKISPQYCFQSYGRLKIQQNSLGNYRSTVSCTLYPWILQYVIKGIKMEEKSSKDQQKPQSILIAQQISKIQQQKMGKFEQDIQNYKQQIKQDIDNSKQNKMIQQNGYQRQQQQQNNQDSSQSYHIVYEFHQTKHSYPDLKTLQILRECLIYFSVKQKYAVQGLNGSQLQSTPRQQLLISNPQNQKQTHIIFSKWLTKQQGIPKGKISIVNRQWIFFTNLLKITQKVYQTCQKSSAQDLKQFENQQLTTALQDKNQDFYRRVLSEDQFSVLAKIYLKLYHQLIKFQVAQANKQQNNSISILQKQEVIACTSQAQFQQRYSIFGISSYSQIQKIKQKFQSIINNPRNQELTKYKVEQSQIPWQEDYYRHFLKSLIDYIYLPTNNRKIATQMSRIILGNASVKTKPKNQSRFHRNSSKKSQQLVIEPNHVKWVKGIYFRNMTRRIDNGECGGGKRGKIMNKEQFIKRDLESFNMKYFKRASNRNNQGSKSKRKKNKKRKSFYGYSSDSEDLVKEVALQEKIQ